MAWAPRQPDYRGLHAVFKALRTITGDNLQHALDWANGALGLQLKPMARVQWAARHARQYPVLTIEPSLGESPQGEADIRHQYEFDLKLETVGTDTDLLAVELTGYLTALHQLFLSATRSDWVQFFVPGTAAFVDFECGPTAFDQVEVSQEDTGLFMRSLGMTLTIIVNEVMP